VRWPPAWELVNWSNELVVDRRQLVETLARKQRTLLRSITRQRLVKTQQTEKN
jgi:hypothetical protein